MANGNKDMWLKVLIGFLITLMLLSFGFTTSKVGKDVFDRHEEYQKVQFDDIKSSLNRIEDKL